MSARKAQPLESNLEGGERIWTVYVLEQRERLEVVEEYDVVASSEESALQFVRTEAAEDLDPGDYQFRAYLRF